MLPDLSSVLWVIFFVLLLTALLNRLLFKPVLGVMEARASARHVGAGAGRAFGERGQAGVC